MSEKREAGLKIVVPIKHVGDKLHDELFVSLLAKEGLLHQVDGLLRERSCFGKFRSALRIIFSQNIKTAFSAAVMQCPHLRTSD